MAEIEFLKNRIKELEKENKELKYKLSNKNSGRKKKIFSESDKELIRMYIMRSFTIRELANMYSCSVGTMHKLIKENRLDKYK